MPCIHRLSDLWGLHFILRTCALLIQTGTPGAQTKPKHLPTQPVHAAVFSQREKLPPPPPPVNAMEILFNLRSVIPLWLKFQLEMKYWMVLIDFCWC